MTNARPNVDELLAMNDGNELSYSRFLWTSAELTHDVELECYRVLDSCLYSILNPCCHATKIQTFQIPFARARINLSLREGIYNVAINQTTEA